MSPRLSARRYRIEHLAVIVLVLLATVFMLRSATLHDLSLMLHDRMAPLVQQPALQQVAVVSFDWRLEDQTRKRQRYAALIERLSAAGASAIVLDAPLTDPALADSGVDQLLEEALRESGRVFLPVRISRAGNSAPLQEIVPFAPFGRASAGLGHVGLVEDADGTVRGLHLRAGVGEAWWPHMVLAVQEALTPGLLDRYPSLDQPGDGGPEVRQYYRLLSFAGINELLRVDGDELLRDELSADQLAGRVVFVGDGPRANETLPLAGAAGGGTSEALALAFAGLAADQLIRPMATPRVWFVTLLLVLLAALLMPRLQARQAPLWWLLALLLVLLVGLGLMAVARLWLPLAPLIGGVLLVYPLWTWRRLEFSLGYLRAAMAGREEKQGLDRRLLLSAPVQSLAEMVDRVLPVRAWRVVRLPSTVVTSGGERMPDRAWQGRQAGQYGFRIQAERYELAVIWQDDHPSAELESWVLAMVRRCADGDEPGVVGPGMEDYLVRVGEQALRERALSSFFQATLTSLTDGVLISDACGNLLYANQRAAAWLDLALELSGTAHLLQLSGRLRFARLREDWAGLLRRAMQEGRCSVECRLEDGTELYLDMLRTRSGENPGEVLIITLRDVSELKSALRGRSQAVDLVSHDLRSPMLSLLALCERRRQEPMTIGDARFVDQIEESTRRSLDIAEQFLQLIRAESLPEEQFVLLDMLAVAEAALEAAAPMAQHQSVRLQFDYLKSEDVWVLGSSDLLELALLNLLHAVIGHAGEGFHVDLRLGREDGRVYCEIADNAPALDEGLRQRWQGGKGVDVPLRLVHAVVERHGGSLAVHSDRHRGNRVTLLLPAAEPE